MQSAKAVKDAEAVLTRANVAYQNAQKDVLQEKEKVSRRKGDVEKAKEIVKNRLDLVKKAEKALVDARASN